MDLGEIHPMAAADSEEGVVYAARGLRTLSQYTNKRVTEFQSALSRRKKKSSRYKRMIAHKSHLLVGQKRRFRYIEREVSRAAADWVMERKVGVLAIGDVRDVADGIDVGRRSNQKIASWSHGKMRRYISNTKQKRRGYAPCWWTNITQTRPALLVGTGINSKGAHTNVKLAVSIVIGM